MSKDITDSVNFDYVIIGSGFSGISVVKGLNDLGVESICMISPEQSGGGLWRNQGKSSRLHHPSNIYLVPGIVPNSRYNRSDNLYCASAAEVQAYAEECYETIQATKITGFVTEVTRLDGAGLEVLYTRHTDNKPDFQEVEAFSVTCQYAIQATGHGHWAGKPRVLGLPFETHSSQLGSKDISGRCLVVGSGRSAADAVKYLVATKGCDVRVLYRRPTVYWKKIDTTWWNRIYERAISCAQALEIHQTAAQAAAKEWNRNVEVRYTDSVAKSMLHWLSGTHWSLGPTPNCDPRPLCRGAGLSRFEYVVLNLHLHAYGERGDATHAKFNTFTTSEGTTKVTCDMFPGELFDHVISATGYMGTQRRFPHCMDATTLIAEPAPYNAYVVGRMLHENKENEALIQEWGDLASRKPRFPYFDANVENIRWAQRNVKESAISASASFKDFMRKNNTYPASWVGTHSPAGNLVFPNSPVYWKLVTTAMRNTLRFCASPSIDPLYVLWHRCLWSYTPRKLSRAIFVLTGKFLFKFLP